MYTRAIHRARALRPRHSVENQWDLLAALGVPPPDRVHDPVDMPERADARRRVDAALASAGLPVDAPLIVLHVSAGNPFRRWPLERFAEAATALVSRDPRRYVVLTSGPSESGAADTVGRLARQALPDSLAQHVARCGEFDLEELRALDARATLYIGGDSGPLHVAATTGTAIVGLYGPTLSVRSAPWRDPSIPTESVEIQELSCRPCEQRVCVHGDFRCLTTVPAQMVVDAAERAMARVKGDRAAPDVAHCGSQS
jgi:ADP-heptose:LPS heptosyltransferase